MNIQEKLHKRNIEHFSHNPEFQKRTEHEVRYMILEPEAVADYLSGADRIEQTYISSPLDEYSLRVRKIETQSGEAQHFASLKSRGSIENGALKRIEIETPINEDAFALFAETTDYPTLHKYRAHIGEGATIDFIDGLSTPLLEIEGSDPAETLQYFSDLSLESVTHEASALNETLAYELANMPLPEQPPTFNECVNTVMESLLLQYAKNESPFVTVGVAGGSGSGKTTVSNEVSRRVVELFGEQYAPIVLSTDDYHRGKKYLETTYGAPWTNWDHPLTYDTEALAHDLDLLALGHPLLKRHFDFQQEEVVYDEAFTPSPFIIIEGIYAGSDDLARHRGELFEMPTGHATAIGRDLMRIITEGRANAAFGTPEERLKYQMETALPTYLKYVKGLGWGDIDIL